MLDGVGADVELLADLPVVEALGDEAGDFEIAIGEEAGPVVGIGAAIQFGEASGAVVTDGAKGEEVLGGEGRDVFAFGGAGFGEVEATDEGTAAAKDGAFHDVFVAVVAAAVLVEVAAVPAAGGQDEGFVGGGVVLADVLEDGVDVAANGLVEVNEGLDVGHALDFDGGEAAVGVVEVEAPALGGDGCAQAVH